ncbi:MAG: acyl-CoA dehydrogenase family protein [Planctomycetota bacterium]
MAELSEDGKQYILNGVKLWCTNGTLAELLVVMARNPKTGRINAFVVETDWEGVSMDHRCRFMGLRALSNAQLSFDNVKVPAENLIGGDGMGLKIALVTLNTGRLSLPAATSGAVKQLVEICRKWGNVRVQWGQPIGKHEAIAHKIADLTATAFAMEAIAEFVGDLADREGVDIRLEAAAAKEWNTVQCWRQIDEALQVRGGRGYETEISLRDRGDCPVPIERIMRDCRINTIFEGSSEIMHLFMAREAVDKHLEVAGALINPKVGWGKKLAALPGMALFYLGWYPKLWFGWSLPPRHSEFGRFATHLRFAEAAARKLARNVFHGMLRFGPKLEKRQAFLFRAVNVAIEIFVITASVARAHRLRELGHEGAESAELLADLAARTARRKIKRLFKELWSNDDNLKYEVGRGVLEGKHEWIERGAVGTGFDAEDMRPASTGELLEERRSKGKPCSSDTPRSEDSGRPVHAS